MARSLRDLGLEREDQAPPPTHDCNDWPVSFLGRSTPASFPVAVNTRLTADDDADMLAHSLAKAAIVSEALLPTLRDAMSKGGHSVRQIIVSSSGAAPEGTVGVSDLLSARPLEAAADTAADEMAFWLYSSGSTGRPKGTVHSQLNPYWTAELYGKGILELRRAISASRRPKLFFAYGLGNGLSFPLSVGATRGADGRAPDPGGRVQALEGSSGHGVLRGTHRLCGDAGLTGTSGPQRGEPAHVLIGWRGTAIVTVDVLVHLRIAAIEFDSGGKESQTKLKSSYQVRLCSRYHDSSCCSLMVCLRMAKISGFLNEKRRVLNLFLDARDLK
jgi:acyl-CoA synthetase (AMP-forming)/AMP-acid ligase II